MIANVARDFLRGTGAADPPRGYRSILRQVMRRARPAVAGLALGLSIFTVPALAGDGLGSEAWGEDMDLMVRKLLGKHPNPFTRVTREEFMRELDAIRSSLPDASDTSVAVRLMRLVGRIGDGHTNLEPSAKLGFDRWFPVRFYEFSDGMFITAVSDEHADLAGAKVEKIGKLEAVEASRLASTLQGWENPFGRKEEVFFLSSAPALRELEIIDSEYELPLEVVTATGRRKTVSLKSVRSAYSLEWRFWGEMFGPPVPDGMRLVTAFGGRQPGHYRMKDADLPLHLRFRRPYFLEHLAKDRTVYMQFNYVQNMSSGSFREFTDHLFSFIDENGVERLIIDVRYNSGGDGSMLLPFAHELIKRDDGVNRPGRLFVLSGRKTFSAGVMFLDLMHDHTAAIFVGEPAGAPFNHYGDATSAILPNSGMKLGTSNRYWQLSLSDDSREEIPVQVPVEVSSADYFAGRDPALELILAGKASRSLVQVLESEGGARARVLYEEMKSANGNPSWWEPFGLREMRHAGERLLEAGRAADALVAFQLNAERFPGSWRVWEGLGDGLFATGNRAGALAAFGKALEISPDNWNKGHQQEMIVRIRDGGGESR